MSANFGTSSVPSPRGAIVRDHSARLAPHCPAQSALDIWVDLVMTVVRADGDIPTLGTWAALAGKSVGSLRLHCYAIHLPPRRTLLFARLLRAVSRACGERWDLGEWLHAADLRTLAEFARLGGIPEAAACTPPISLYLAQQRLLPADSRAVRAVRIAIGAAPPGSPSSSSA
jgi:hypothetical protein